MNEKIGILTDTGTDVSVEEAEQLGIELLPLHINFKNEEYLDSVDITPAEVYDKMEEEIPKTSIPSPGEIGDKLDEMVEEGYDKFVIITISSGLSGIYNAAELILEEKDLDSFVFDTKGIGLMSGAFAIYAAELRNEGKSFDEIVAALKKNKNNSIGFYTIETLKYLIKGGRLGRVSGVLAGVLNIKPIISIDDDGIYYTVKKVRGQKRSVKAIADLLREKIKKPYRLYLCEGQNPKALEMLKEYLSEEIREADRVQENQITATLGVHTGPGLIGGVVFSPEE